MSLRDEVLVLEARWLRDQVVCQWCWERAIRGTAGRKRRRLIEQRACDEKTIDSKVNHLIDAEPQEPAPAPKLVVPEAVLPSSSDDDFQEDTHVAAKRMPD